MSTTKRRRDEDASDALLTLHEAETSLRGAAALREALEQRQDALAAEEQDVEGELHAVRLASRLVEQSGAPQLGTHGS